MQTSSYESPCFCAICSLFVVTRYTSCDQRPAANVKTCSMENAPSEINNKCCNLACGSRPSALRCRHRAGPEVAGQLADAVTWGVRKEYEGSITNVAGKQLRALPRSASEVAGQGPAIGPSHEAPCRPRWSRRHGDAVGGETDAAAK